MDAKRRDALSRMTGIDPGQPISPMDVISGAGKALDSVTGAPTRAALGAMQKGESMTEAFGKQFAEDPEQAPTMEQLFENDPVTAPYSKGALPFAAEMVADPSNLIPGKAALSGLMAAGIIKKAGKAAKVAKGVEEVGKVAKATDEALDMSHAARMARAKEMGFDTSKTFYHGTKGELEGRRRV
jgi:hypothetical protein